MLSKFGIAALAALSLTSIAPASANPFGFGAHLQGAAPVLTEQVQRRGAKLVFTDGVTERWSDGTVRPGPHARGRGYGQQYGHYRGRGHYGEGRHYGERRHYGQGAYGGQHGRGGPVMTYTNGVVEHWSDGSVRPGPHARR